MNGRGRLAERERQQMLEAYRSGRDGRVARRAQVLMFFTGGVNWETFRSMRYASSELIAENRRTFLTGGVEGVLGEIVGDASDTVLC